MPDSKPTLSPGSLLNSSEGLLSTGCLAGLTSVLTTSTDYRVQMSAAIGIAVLGSVYVYTRGMVKVGRPDA
jgi:hypothetical protein